MATSHRDLLTRRSWLQTSAAGLGAAAVASSSLGAPTLLANSTAQSITVALVGSQYIHTPGFANRMADSDIAETRYVWDSNPDTARRRQDVTGGEVIDDPQIAFDDPEIGDRHHYLADGTAPRTRSASR